MGQAYEMGTWDEWLLTRPQPEPAPGEKGVAISNADFVARALLAGGTAILDFTMAPIRQGLIDLFAEFETATAGQVPHLRQYRASERQMELSVTVTPERKVRVLASHGADEIGTDLPVEKALELADLILRCARFATENE